MEYLANLAYVFKTQGGQDYEYGDLLSTSLFVHVDINPASRAFKTSAGLATNFQYEQKHTDKGSEVRDSGGTTLLMGPDITIKANDRISVFGSLMFPVHQDLGGEHQELDYVWSAGGRLAF
ncbi:MAG: hypothetical protein Q8Q08_02585 [Candidatus Omnitrophota bacterium]|nr:hypothetical protein [Candidatus Omnitrophota bacterium]MDZ4243425.1 hypothetical protein [Candidatus Omnitrophota bacterium]